MNNDIVTTYNQHLEDFLKYTIKVCPCDNSEMRDIKADIVSYSGLINAAIKLDRNIFIEKYIQYVLIHEDAINARDEKFFLDMNYKQTYQNNSDISLMEVLKFKSLWPKLSDKVRGKLFDFVIILTYWARQYFNAKFAGN
jgi:hypothetical protein